MSNPFDQFATEFQAALPPNAPGAAKPAEAAPPIFGAPAPAAPPTPVMNSPLQPMGYGAPPPPYGQTSPQPNYGQPQPAYSPQPAYGQPSPQPVYGQHSPQPAYGQQPPFGVPSSPPRAHPQPQQRASDPFSAYGQGPPTQPALTHESFPPKAHETTKPADNNPFAAMPAEPAPEPSSQPAPEPPAANGYADPWSAPLAQPQYGAPPPPPVASPSRPPYGAPPPQHQPPFGAPPQPPTEQAPPFDQGALVVAPQQNNPYAQPPPPQQQQMAPYGPPAGNPYGQPAYGYQQPPPPTPVDPFSVFEAKNAPPPAAAPEPTSSALVVQPEPAPVSDDEFWGSLASGPPVSGETGTSERVSEEKKGDDGLPPGGEWYDARIFTPTLGVMFFKPQELTDSLFLNTDKDLVDSLGDRPVVAFIVEGSSARSAGVELGHVLLKVNGVDVKNPKEASRLIKEGPRPLPLLFYVPNTDVVVAEGEHMVKYDTRETTAPNSAKDWKPKYVVIGGIIAQPWMMNMYRSKSEYDIAVIETQARRPVTVKVKQFSLQGARIQNDWQGPQMVKYKNKLHPWKYIVVLPVARNPIKISSPNLAQLKPVHEGIRRVLLAQQRSRGGGHSNNTAAPVRSRDSYDNRSAGEDQSRERERDQYRSSDQYSHTSGGDNYRSSSGGENYRSSSAGDTYRSSGGSEQYGHGGGPYDQPHQGGAYGEHGGYIPQQQAQQSAYHY